MAENNNYALTRNGLMNYIEEEKGTAFIYDCENKNNSNFRYNNINQTVEGKKDNGEWVTMRTYCIPPYKEDYGREISDYYQVVRGNLEMIFEELQEMRELANAKLVRKEVSDACFIADCVLTFLAAQIDRVVSGADDAWSDIHSMDEIFKEAAKEGSEKTIEVSMGRKAKDTNWFEDFLNKLEEFLELPGDYFAVNRPAWDAIMEKVNQKLIKDESMSQDTVKKVSEIINKQGEVDVTKFNSEVLKYGMKLLVFYKKEVVINTIAAEIMQGFVLRGLTLIENVRNLNFNVRAVARVCRGIVDIAVAPAIAQEVKEKIEESSELIVNAIKNGKVVNLKEAIEIPGDIITSIYKRTIKNYNLADKFGAIENLYSYYEEKIENKKYGFIAAHKIDGPNISFGVKVLINDFPKYIIPKTFNKMNKLIFGNKTGIIGKAYKAEATYQRMVETIEEYNTDVLDYNKLDTIISDLEGIKKLHEYREEDISFTAVFDVTQEDIKKVKEEIELFSFSDPLKLDLGNTHYPGCWTQKSYAEYKDSNVEFHLPAINKGMIDLDSTDKPLKYYVQLFKKKFNDIYKQAEEIKMYRVEEVVGAMGERKSEATLYILYKVQKRDITSVSKRNGVFALECKRGRLDTGESILKLHKMKEIINLNSDFRGQISEDGSFIILREGILDLAVEFTKGKFNREHRQKLKDIKFPDSYQPNYHTLFGSGEIEGNDKAQDKPFNFKMGMGNRKTYYSKDSNPAVKIKINQEIIGENIKVSDRYLKQLKENYKTNYTSEIYIEEDFDKGFKLIYQFSPNFSNPGQHHLMILYGPTFRVDKKLDYLLTPENADANPELDRLIIKNFKNGDYGIYLPRCHRLYGSLNANPRYGGERNLKQFKVRDYRRQKKKRCGGGSIEVELGSKNNQETLTLGKDIEIVNKFSGKQERIEYKDENEVYYLYYVDEGKVKIKYGKGDFENNKRYYPGYGESIIIENYRYGDFNLHLETGEAILFGSKFTKQKDNGKVVVLDRKEPQTNKEGSSKKQDDKERRYEFAPGQARYYVHYNSDEDDRILIKYFGQFEDISKLDVEYRYDFDYKKKEDDTYKIYERYKSELKKAKTKTILYEYIEDPAEDRYELVIRYYNSDGEKQQKIRIKEFQNEDYGIKLPPVKVDQISGGGRRMK